MPNMFDQSFLNDMNDSFMMEEMTGQGFGTVVDEMVESELSQTHLFESKQDKEWKNALSDVEDDDDILADGDMIDSMI